MLKYYNSQKIHKVAVIKSDTNGIFDSENIMSVDVSNFDKIEKNNIYLCNKLSVSDDLVIDTMAELSNIDPTIMFGFKNNMVNYTNINSRGFKYSTSSKEVCMLRYIPKDHIISLLDAIQMDIIMVGRFDGNFIKMNPLEQEKELKRFKNILLNRLKLFGDNYLLYLFEELYVKNLNIKELTSVKQSRRYIERCKNDILRLSLKIPTPMIKR